MSGSTVVPLQTQFSRRKLPFHVVVILVALVWLLFDKVMGSLYTAQRAAAAEAKQLTVLSLGSFVVDVAQKYVWIWYKTCFVYAPVILMMVGV